MGLRRANKFFGEDGPELQETFFSAPKGERFRPTGGKGRLLVKFGSHRARDRGLGLLGGKKRQGFYSLHRDTGKGVYEVTKEEFDTLKSSGIKGVVKFKDGDDLRNTW